MKRPASIPSDSAVNAIPAPLPLIPLASRTSLSWLSMITCGRLHNTIEAARTQNAGVRKISG
jgi:hypothetical protein